ncbi:MAG: bifunctional helix-turn-helix transcriptional regulator/GNAT family N-acetyltransferase [Planctomycetota bacterium]|jgi:DNA-binding MarR family transcriptional regulator/GNAT superfamily N-acetyltransferase
MDRSRQVSRDALLRRVEKVRRFNRFYTRRIGVLREGLLGSEFKLTEARVLFEIAHRGETTATELATELDLDGGYLSRIIQGLGRRGLVQRSRSAVDGRQRLICLSEAGSDAFADLNSRSRHLFEGMLAELSDERQDRLIEAMETIQAGLGGPVVERSKTFILRPHQPGDIGWVVYRHGVLYHQEYDWDETFEGLVASVLGKFEKSHDPDSERCWIAEADGCFAGCVFVMKDSDAVARLRCLLVEPFARGLGVGSRLVQECIDFARRCDYERLTLWTNDVLDAARRIYQRAGFRLSEEKPPHSFGHDLVGQTWDLDLVGRRPGAG